MAVISKDDDLTWVRFGSAPLIVTLVLPIVIGVIILLKCILNHCCVRKTTTKEEMYGVEGRMTILPNVETSFVTTPLQQTLPLQSQSQTKTITIVPTSRKSPVETLLLQQQQKRLTSYERSESQQSHRSSTKSASTLGNKNTSPMIPNISPVSSHASAAEPQATENCETVDLTDSLKRSTLHRQLPDLPQLPNLQALHPPRRSSSVLSHDGNSELYATVGEVPNTSIQNIPQPSGPDGRSYYNGKSISSHPSASRGTVPGTSGTSKNVLVNSKSEPTPSSDSETYASNHPYAKLKRPVGEHPYARVRTISAGRDEETDTDNYDTPHPYAQTGRSNLNRNSQPTGSSQSNTRDDGENTSAPQPNTLNSSAIVGDVNRQPGNPIPPRRTGRQWRRGSNPQAQINDNQPQHFSGDSQDSRGYTSISVREPLSNIIANRNEVAHTRHYDSHYATVSDDSEEMYAAIEDSDGNYMRISGEDGEHGGRHWHGGPNIASPIPERREANSPLPPPPPVPPLASPPELSPTGPSTMDQSHQANQTSSISNPNPPLYAQVTKKNKKGKAPVTPTSSINASSSHNNSNSISNNTTTTNEIKSSVNSSSPLPTSQISGSAGASTATNKTRHIVSEATVPLLSPLDPSGNEPRRWSKADISYSEFEVVREPLYSMNMPASSSVRGRRKSPESSAYQHAEKKQNSNPSEKSSTSNARKIPDMLDEDNYNVIGEPVPLARSSREVSNTVRKVSNSNNYQEILDTYQICNPYQEIDRKEPSDYYQEIGARVLENGVDGSANLYQEIDKTLVKSTVTAEIEDEEDLNDQFYETVKPAGASKPKYLASPSHSQGSVTSLDRKHGYEKLKKKGSGPPPVVIIASDDDDEEEDDEDENKNEDSMYERVKYPPYERLKESRDDLHEIPRDDEQLERNFYEDICYTRVKPKHKRSTPAASAASEVNTNLPRSDDVLDNKKPKDTSEFSTISNNNPYGSDMNSEVSNLDQLYARIDKTKKKKHANSMEASSSTSFAATTTLVNNDNISSGKDESHESVVELRENTPKACIVLRTDRDDNSIEYI